jgi:hypothetical protein
MHRVLSLIVSVLVSAVLMTALIISLGELHAHATPSLAMSAVQSPVGLGEQQMVTPVVAIALPVPDAILTTTQPLTYQVQIDWDYGTSIITDAVLLEAVSVTVNGGATYHEAISGVVPGRYVYSWTLPFEDYASHVLIAQARNGWGNIGSSTPMTVYVDMRPPQRTAITVPAYTENTSLTVLWSATDGSKIITYDLQYRRDDQTMWTDWLTDSSAISQVFTVPTPTVAEGHDYAFRMQARDRGNNRSDWVTDVARVGRYHLYLPLVAHRYPPPWQQADKTENISFYDLVICPNNHLLQYAGTKSNGLYRSTDGGETWQHWALDKRATPVVVNPLDCDEAFVAVWGEGVHRVTGQNSTEPVNQGLAELYLYALAISADGQTLYAGSNTQGMYRASMTDFNWDAINNGIPAQDRRIRSLYTISDTLYVGSRQCTFYRSGDGGDSWQAETILSGGQSGDCGDAQVWAIAKMGNVLYASLGLEKGLYQRPDGEAWTRVLDVPAVNIFRFGLLSYLSRLYVGTYGSGVYICESDGRCYLFPNGGLGESNIRGLAIAEVSSSYPRLLAGSNNGIWWVPLLP